MYLKVTFTLKWIYFNSYGDLMIADERDFIGEGISCWPTNGPIINKTFEWYNFGRAQEKATREGRKPGSSLDDISESNGLTDAPLVLILNE